MQSATTETFSVSFPPVYEHIQIAWESIRGEHREDDGYLSYVSLGLTELSFYSKYKGVDLLSQFRESCLEQRGIVEVISDKTLPVAGLTADIRTAKSPDNYYYYFGLVKINDEYGYTIIGDCDVSSMEYYEPVFDEIWQSLQYFGNPVEAMKKQKEGIDAIFAKYKTAAPSSEPEEKIIPPFEVPSDGNEYWQIGEESFTLKSPPEISISDGDGALYIRVEAQAPADSKVINDYEDGKVYLQFYFKGIYNAGIPTGVFHFKDEREDTYLSYCWKGGFEYSQSLTANVTLAEGWMGIEGHFNETPVKLAVKLQADIPWEKYRFLSVDEVSSAPAAQVQYLWLKDPYPGILEETLYPLTELRLLGLDYQDKKIAADLKGLPKALKRMKQLQELSLTGVSGLESLPQWLGDLKTLERIRVNESKIEGIHPYIFQLPELQKLYLDNNQLSSIHRALPEKLETLTLNGNQLTTVPDSVARLDYLSLEKNPLQKLPADIEKVPSLYLELEKKMTLLDYTYKGADGKGTVPYDNSRFLATADPELLAHLTTQISENDLNEFKDGLLNRTRKAVSLETTEEDTYDGKGNHRFGGLPDLPAATSYPTFKNWEEKEEAMQFIAQINCGDIAHLQDYLPRTGILYFFIQDQEDIGPKVIYYDGDQLQSAKDLQIEPLYTPFKAQAGKYPSMPSLYNAHDLYPELAKLADMYDETESLENGLRGYSVPPVHSMNSYVFKQHDTPEYEAVDKKKGKQEEWMVLLRVSSDSNTGFCFWDAGEIYFVIHKSDLEKKDFTNVYCGLESS